MSRLRNESGFFVLRGFLKYIGVAKWLKATVSKTVKRNLLVGSNPTTYADNQVVILEIFFLVLYGDRSLTE